MHCHSFLYRYYGFLKGVTNVIGLTGGLVSSTLTGMMLSQVRNIQTRVIIFLVLIAQEKKVTQIKIAEETSARGEL